MPLKWDWSCPFIISRIKAFAIKAKTEKMLLYRRNLYKYQLSLVQFFEQLVFCCARAMGALQTALMVRFPKNARVWPSPFIVSVCCSYGYDQLTLCCFCPAAPPTVYVWKQHVCATAQPGCDGVWVREGDRSGESKHFITVEWRRTLRVSSLWVNALETRKRPPLASLPCSTCQTKISKTPSWKILCGRYSRAAVFGVRISVFVILW